MDAALWAHNHGVPRRRSADTSVRAGAARSSSTATSRPSAPPRATCILSRAALEPVAEDRGMTRGRALYRARSQCASWRPGCMRFPTSPRKRVDATLAALWHAAAGAPVSAEARSSGELPAIDGAAPSAACAGARSAWPGAPLAHLTGRQRFMGLELLAAGPR
jgi:hypothetical protein